MTIVDPVHEFDLIFPSMIAANRKQLITLTAEALARRIGISEKILTDRLIDKDKTMPSALGGGLAALHLHIASLNEPVSAFVKLKNPIDFAAPDNAPVDLLFVLLTPEREGTAFLRTIARLSRFLRNPAICHKLRTSEDERAIRSVFETGPAQTMAA